MKHALAKITDTPHTASKITKSIDVLMTIQWIKHVWDSVKSNTITNCLRHCGFFFDGADISDPFAELDDQDDEFDAELEKQVGQFGGDMSANTHVNCGDDLATCTTFEDASNWREELRGMIISRATKKLQEMGSASDDEEEREEESCTVVITFMEAIDYGNIWSKFPTEKGEDELFQDMFKVVQKMEYAKLKHSRQTSILSFMSAINVSIVSISQQYFICRV